MPAVTIDVPRAYEASPGIVRGHVRADVTQVLVYAKRGSRPVLLGSTPVRRRAFRFGPFGLRRGDQTIVVVAYDAGTRVGSARVYPVYGLPSTALVTASLRRTSAASQKALRRIDGPGVTAVWARGMKSGIAAGYNADARFTAASTLKLAILMTAFAHAQGDPVARANWPAVERMILYSDNGAADDVEVSFGGSTSGGSALVNAFCRSMGCRDTDMYGGYERSDLAAARSPAAAPPALDVVERPSIPTYGKHTTAHDLGVLLVGLLQAAHGQGRAMRLGVSAREARVGLWLLLHARYTGVVRPTTSAAVGHKAGWNAGIEHDAALVFTREGTVVLVILSQGGSAGPTATGRYARRVAKVILHHLP